MNLYYFMLCFFVYGFLGWCTEVGYAAVKSGRFVNRGFLNGPICPIYGVGVSVVIAFLTPYRSNILVLYVLSVVLVTVLEGVTGFAMDKIFHNKWWDYSNQPLNIGGYVCLVFSIAWGVACVFIVEFFHPVVDRLINFLPEAVGVILLVILSITLVIDLIVTSSMIFKMNRRLESMEKIAAELKQISNQIGGEIYKGVSTTMERQESAGEFKTKLQETTEGMKDRLQETSEGMRDKLMETSESMRERIQYLKNSYQELGETGNRVSKRLVKAFPKMQNRKSGVQFEAFRTRIYEKWKKK
ncbi:MAG: hypothetical protein PHN80_06670 [Hespellia sp.]|nr:hypothetical protein [Hespellia sp.]